jgi:hypothetical protein
MRLFEIALPIVHGHVDLTSKQWTMLQHANMLIFISQKLEVAMHSSASTVSSGGFFQVSNLIRILPP